MVFSEACAVFSHTRIMTGAVNPVSFRHHESFDPGPTEGSWAYKGILGLERDWYGRQLQCDRRCQGGRDVFDAPVFAFEIPTFSIDQVNRGREKSDKTPPR